MMKIAYTPPQIDAETVAARADFLDQMSRLRDLLNQVASRMPGRTLSSRDRRALKRRYGFDPLLVDNLVFVPVGPAVDLIDAPARQTGTAIGFTWAALRKDLYASPSLLAQYATMNDGLCSFCETLIPQDQSGILSHFRPPTALLDDQQSTLQRSPYGALAYTDKNLHYACAACALHFQRFRFPLASDRFPSVPLERELPNFLDPYVDSPRQNIRFNPLNAKAYPFDRVFAFYDNYKQDHDLPPTESLINSNPTMIPDQTDLYGQPLSDPNIDEAYNTWWQALTQAQRDRLNRGQTTIDGFGLNRPSLVRSRAAYLAVLLSGHQSKLPPDGQPPAPAPNEDDPFTDFFKEPAFRLGEPYRSAEIDATAAWMHDTAPQVPWMERYRVILSDTTALKTPLPMIKRDDVMLLQVASEYRIQDRQRFVMLEGNDPVYGYAYGLRGLFQALDWRDDLSRQVVVQQQGLTVRSLSMTSLLNLPGTQRAQLFDNYRLWVLGLSDEDQESVA